MGWLVTGAAVLAAIGWAHSSSVCAAQEIELEISVGNEIALCGAEYSSTRCPIKVDIDKYARETSPDLRKTYKIKPWATQRLSVGPALFAHIKNYSGRYPGNMPEEQFQRSIVLSFELSTLEFETFELMRSEGTAHRGCEKYEPYREPAGDGWLFWHGRLECADPLDGVTYTITLIGTDPEIKYSLVFVR